MLYAIVESGGKQVKTTEGQYVDVDRLPLEISKKVKFDKVLLLVSDEKTEVGTPYLKGVSVDATVTSHFKGKKIIVFKYRPKQRYRVKTGHRQVYTRLIIDTIAFPGKAKAELKKGEVKKAQTSAKKDTQKKKAAVVKKTTAKPKAAVIAKKKTVMKKAIAARKPVTKKTAVAKMGKPAKPSSTGKKASGEKLKASRTIGSTKPSTVKRTSSAKTSAAKKPTSTKPRKGTGSEKTTNK